MVMFAHDPNRMEFIYGMILEKYQYKLVLFFCLAVEFFILNFAFCNAAFGAIVQLGMFRKCLLDLKIWQILNTFALILVMRELVGI